MRWRRVTGPAPDRGPFSFPLDSRKKNDYSFFMPRLSESALTARRDHILRAADLCFARDGYHATTIASVRKEAGVSTGAIYTYFPNKEAMMRAILDRARDERKRQLAAAAEDMRPDAALVLLQWALDVFSTQGRHAACVDVNLWAESLRNPGIRKLAQGALRDARSAVSAVVRSRLSSVESSSLEPDSVAAVLIALFLGLEVQTAVGVRLEPNEVVRVLGTLFADYLPGGTDTTRVPDNAVKERAAGDLAPSRARSRTRRRDNPHRSSRREP